MTSFALSAAIAINLFLAAIVLRANDGRRVHLWSASLLGLLATEQLVLLLANEAAFGTRPPLWLIAFSTLFFLNGPALWAVARAAAGRPLYAPRHLVHIAPAVLHLAVTLMAPLMLGDAYSAEIVGGLVYTSQLLTPWSGLAAMVTAGVYVGFGYAQLSRATPGSNAHLIRWIRRWLISNAGLLLVSTILFAPPLLGSVIPVGLSLAILSAGFLGQSVQLAWSATTKHGVVSAERSTIDPAIDDLARLDARLNRTMLHLDPDLTAPRLADAMGWSIETLRAAVSSRADGIPGYINARRVAAAQNYLNRKMPPTTILEIAYQSGFASKSAFNAAFRRETGMTPTQYLQHQPK